MVNIGKLASTDTYYRSRVAANIIQRVMVHDMKARTCTYMYYMLYKGRRNYTYNKHLNMTTVYNRIAIAAMYEYDN